VVEAMVDGVVWTEHHRPVDRCILCAEAIEQGRGLVLNLFRYVDYSTPPPATDGTGAP
jgi:hypothetical protein